MAGERPKPESGAAVQVRGTVTRIKWEADDGSNNAIFEVRSADGERTMCVGRFETAPRAWVDREVCVVGRWQTHERFGPQVRADAVVQVVPRDQAGVVKYLRETLGIADSLARKLWTRFKEKAPEVLRERPGDVAATGVVDTHQADQFSRQLARLKGVDEAFISLSALFAGRRIPTGVVRACIDQWGANAPEVVRADPYRLMELPGYAIGFARADSIYLDLGGDPHLLKRQTLFIAHAIANNRDGHTWRRGVDVAVELGEELERRGGAEPRVKEAIQAGLDSGLLSRRRDQSDFLWLSARRMDRDEGDVARMLGDLLIVYGPIGSAVADLRRIDDHDAARIESEQAAYESLADWEEFDNVS